MNAMDIQQSQFSARGFTLIELMVVITILGILASLILGNINSARLAARDSSRLQEAKQLQTALEIYRNNNGGHYPCGVVTSGTLNCVMATSPTDGTVNGATALYIKRQATGTYTAAEILFRGNAGVKFSPNPDSIARDTIIYRLGSLAGNSSNAPDRNSYTLVIWEETQGSGGGWCKIVQGTVHAAYASNTTYPLCNA